MRTCWAGVLNASIYFSHPIGHSLRETANAHAHMAIVTPVAFLVLVVAEVATVDEIKRRADPAHSLAV